MHRRGRPIPKGPLVACLSPQQASRLVEFLAWCLVLRFLLRFLSPRLCPVVPELGLIHPAPASLSGWWMSPLRVAPAQNLQSQPLRSLTASLVPAVPE